jgi:hypothetical protein
MNAPNTVTRVIHHLDEGGNVQKIEWEPVGNVAARRICVTQTRELVLRANEMIVAVQNWRASANTTATAAAAAQITFSAQMEKLRHAVIDLRPYLEIMARTAEGGMSFPGEDTRQMPARPQIQRRHA